MSLLRSFEELLRTRTTDEGARIVDLGDGFVNVIFRGVVMKVLASDTMWPLGITYRQFLNREKVGPVCKMTPDGVKVYDLGNGRVQTQYDECNALINRDTDVMSTMGITYRQFFDDPRFPRLPSLMEVDLTEMLVVFVKNLNLKPWNKKDKPYFRYDD